MPSWPDGPPHGFLGLLPKREVMLPAEASAEGEGEGVAVGAAVTAAPATWVILSLFLAKYCWTSSTVRKPSLLRFMAMNSSTGLPLFFHLYSAIWPSPSVSSSLNQGGRSLGSLPPR